MGSTYNLLRAVRAGKAKDTEWRRERGQDEEARERADRGRLETDSQGLGLLY